MEIVCSYDLCPQIRTSNIHKHAKLHIHENYGSYRGAFHGRIIRGFVGHHEKRIVQFRHIVYRIAQGFRHYCSCFPLKFMLFLFF